LSPCVRRGCRRPESGSIKARRLPSGFVGLPQEDWTALAFLALVVLGLFALSIATA
jgi:hypothetical protein